MREDQFAVARPGARGARARRVLLSEGSSTSAREAVTALGLAGHHVEIADPDRHCLARFSRFVRRFHRCPPLGTEPEGYRDFMLGLVAEGDFDVLLPTHEQGYLLARIAGRLTPRVAVALPAFESYARAVSRIGFDDLLAELDLPRPRTIVAASARELTCLGDFPRVVKTEFGTASRTVWMVDGAAGLARALAGIGRAGGPVLVQELVEGPVEHAQAVFSHGRLVAMHACRQLRRGAGGGAALKESVRRPGGRADLARIGEALGWHGALSVDYIPRPADGAAVYIDCNPRLVEPMSARIAGLDLVDVLLRVSAGEEVPEQPPGRPGVRTRLAMQALMGAALAGAGRAGVLREGWRALTGSGDHAGSHEELTPVRRDPHGLLPLVGAAAALAISPGLAGRLAGGGWGAHLLTPETVRAVAAWPDA